MTTTAEIPRDTDLLLLTCPPFSDGDRRAMGDAPFPAGRRRGAVVPTRRGAQA